MHKLQLKSFLFALILMSFFSCKNEFEKIRTSGDVDKIYKKGVQLYDKGEYSKAQSLFELVLSNFRGKEEAEQLYYKYAYTHFYLNNYLLSAYYFKSASNIFQTGSNKEECDFMAAFSNYKLSPDYKLDQTETLKAIDGFQAFINIYPESERVVECNNLIDELRKKMAHKEDEQAKLYFNIKQYQSAINSYNNLLNDYPDITDREQLRFMIIRSYYLWAENSFATKQADRFKLMLAKYEEFVNKYPKSKYLRNAREFAKSAKLKLKELET